MTIRVLAGAVLLGALAMRGGEPVTAQVPSTFEVTSVKRNTSGSNGWSLNPLVGGRFTARNVPVRDVILYAYGLRDFQLADDPGWLRTMRFDIEGNAGGDVPFQQLRDLVKGLLADRFGFAAHKEMREHQTHALVLLREGIFGPALKRTTRDCAAARKEAVRVAGDGCGSVVRDTGTISGGGVPIAMLANSLSAVLNSVVSDQTGLSGDFDFELRWSDAADAAKAVPLSDVPALTTAVQEQLGLRLQPQRGPIEVLVVDRVSPPTEN